MRFFGRVVISVACGVTAGLIAHAAGSHGNVPFYVGCFVACVVQIVQG